MKLYRITISKNIIKKVQKSCEVANQIFLLQTYFTTDRTMSLISTRFCDEEYLLCDI